PAEKRSGMLTDLKMLSPEIAELTVTADRPLTYWPGQYVRLKFSGYPAREYSPTVRLDGTSDANELIFHIRILRDGVVSSALGGAIQPGHRVHIQGPFGSAFLREGQGPLILISGGTGWAPVWSLARAARETQRDRHLIVI